MIKENESFQESLLEQLRLFWQYSQTYIKRSSLRERKQGQCKVWRIPSPKN